jgi:hypothetical protein
MFVIYRAAKRKESAASRARTHQFHRKVLNGQEISPCPITKPMHIATPVEFLWCTVCPRQHHPLNSVPMKRAGSD